MLNRYLDQTRSRRGFAGFGLLFTAFGAFMAYIDSIYGAVLFGGIGLFCLVPALLLNRQHFNRFESIASWLGALG